MTAAGPLPHECRMMRRISLQGFSLGELHANSIANLIVRAQSCASSDSYRNHYKINSKSCRQRPGLSRLHFVPLQAPFLKEADAKSITNLTVGAIAIALAVRIAIEFVLISLRNGSRRAPDSHGEICIGFCIDLLEKVSLSSSGY